MKGYRIGVYWEETGTTAEGSMEDEQAIVLRRKPTKKDMESLKHWMEKLLLELGLVKRGGR